MKTVCFELYRPSNMYRIQNGIVKDISPFMLHMGMFVPTIFGQASAEQASEWLPQALSLQIIGTYAQVK